MAWEIWRAAARALSFAWRSLVLTDLTYKAIGFAVLTPATILFLRWMLSRTGAALVADADIATFFFTTPPGIVALLFGSSVIIGITAVESACLMVVGLAATRGIRLSAKGALMFGASRAVAVLRLAARMVARILLALVPFAVAAGAAYFGLLRDHDINYYLARKPTEFWIAAAFVAVIVVILVALLLRTVARWALALPLLLFEDVSPARAIGESTKRAVGHRGLILGVLIGWFVLALALNAGLTVLLEMAGRSAGPHLAGSITTLLVFVGVLAFVWICLGLAVAIFNAALFSVLVVLLYQNIAASEGAGADAIASAESAGRVRASPAMVAGIGIVVVFAAIALILFAFAGSRKNQPVLVIAHRGSSLSAPENTLAAFRLAATERSDFIELDVQETIDGTVIVNHDGDLMKLGASPMKIWEHTHDELRTVDIGSYFSPEFKDERVATLAESLAASKGSKVLVELKSYGHNQRLEERVAEVVEKEGMVNECIYMSLDHSMVRKMKQIRPSWRVGLLAAKVMGDITSFGADFVAVEARMATVRFVRQAHRAGQDVYVWTVDDPAWMLSAMSNGADGLITNKPALAREVVAKHARMSQAQRILVALLVRLGASTDSLESENALRP